MRYFWIQEQVRDADFSIKKEKHCVNVGTKPIFASVLQHNCKLQDWYSTDHGSHTSRQDDGDEPMMDLAEAAYSETRAQKQREKQTVVSVDRYHRDGCAS